MIALVVGPIFMHTVSLLCCAIVALICLATAWDNFRNEDAGPRMFAWATSGFLAVSAAIMNVGAVL